MQQDEVCCVLCGQKIVWEHPPGSGHFQYASSYLGIHTCRDCMEEHCCQTNCLHCDIGSWPDCSYLYLKGRS